MKQFLIFTVLFYFLVLLQASFLAHFELWGYAPNLILISVVLINILQRAESNSGLTAAAFGGLFLDIFSNNFIGFWVLILLAAALIIKFVLKNYVSLPKLC